MKIESRCKKCGCVCGQIERLGVCVRGGKKRRRISLSVSIKPDLVFNPNLKSGSTIFLSP